MAPLREQLPHIESNNLVFLDLCPGDIAEDDDLEEASRVIRANTSIEELFLADFEEEQISKYEPLFHGISQIKSMKYIEVYRSDVCHQLLLILGKSISELCFAYCNIKVDIFASVLLATNLLSYFDFKYCNFKLDEGIKPTKRTKVETGDKEIHVETLRFKSTHLGKHGFETVSRFLLHPNLTLKTINIDNSYTYGGGEQWDISFLNGFKGCKSLEKIICSNSGENNLILLSSVLPDLSLRELGISRIQISSDTERALSHGILQNGTIESIMLETTGAEWAKIIPACLSPTSVLKAFNINNNDDITDSVMLSLSESLANNSTLEDLDLIACYNVTSTGWLRLFSAIGSPHCSLKRLSLAGTTIDDHAIIVLANDLDVIETLEGLDLRSCNGVTANGWRALSRLLGSPRSSLKILAVCNNRDINDDIVATFTNDLSANKNSQLECLALDDFDSMHNATFTFWDPIMNLLCSTSSIDATWSSNHTLSNVGEFVLEESDQDIDFDEDEDEVRLKMPREIHELLKMNEDEDKKQVARRKVIKYHFTGDFDLSALIGHDQKLLPRKISWLGRDSLGLSVVYGIISRTLPDLCQNDEK